MIRQVILLAAAALACFEAVPGRAQQSYPNRPVKIIAPVQPGGGVDLVARTMADQLGKLLKATFIVENVAGGGGVIASQSVAHAAPDGYTLMIAYVGTHGTSPAVRKLPYDAVQDFTPIAMVGGTPNVLVVNSSVPAKDMASFLDYVRRNPGKLSYGSAGQGSLTHLAMEQFKSAAGFDAVHAAYRGIGPAITDTLGGQTQMMMPGLAAALPHIRGGMLRPIAVTGLTRHRLLPDVPTFKELGYQDFDGVQWYGLVGPARLPADIAAKLNAAVNESLNNPTLRERLAGEALETMPMTPAQFAEFIRADIARWSRLASEHNIKLED
jgi:tripartite-type tricarboxylate transporter receptor subunit TctC